MPSLSRPEVLNFLALHFVASESPKELMLSKWLAGC
jgi:hypothetical protein